MPERLAESTSALEVETPANAGSGSRHLSLGARRGLAVLLGGMVGGGARIGVSVLFSAEGFPWGTLVANITGAFLLGYLLTRLLHGSRPTTTAIPLWCTGVLGSYTTFSTFALETWQLVEDGQLAVGIGYGLGSVVVGLAAAALGIRLAEAHA